MHTDASANDHDSEHLEENLSDSPIMTKRGKTHTPQPETESNLGRVERTAAELGSCVRV